MGQEMFQVLQQAVPQNREVIFGLRPHMQADSRFAGGDAEGSAHNHPQEAPWRRWRKRTWHHITSYAGAARRGQLTVLAAARDGASLDFDVMMTHRIQRS